MFQAKIIGIKAFGKRQFIAVIITMGKQLIDEVKDLFDIITWNNPKNLDWPDYL